MIAKEVEGLDEEILELSNQEKPGEYVVEGVPAPKFDIEPRYMYRYNEVTLRGKKFLAPKSCKGCYGTGKVGRVQDARTHEKYMVFCTCLIQPQEEDDAKKEEG